MTENEIRKVVVIDALPDVVFKAISDPQELTEWFPDAAILEPKVGGRFQFTFYRHSDRRKKDTDRDSFPEGRILEFIPNKKLAYSWRHKDVPDFPETVVTWELEQLDKRKTRVTLTHSGFTGREEGKGFEQHEQGWDYFVARLVEHCNERTAKPGFPARDKPTSFTIEQSYYFEVPPKEVFKAVTDPKILVKWFLSRAKVVPREGGTYSFDWIGGYHMTGRVRRFETNKVVSYSWHDEMPDGEMVETTALFQFTKKGRGTLLKLRHSGFSYPEHFAECSSRWAYYLTNMKSVLDGGADLRSKYDW